VQFEEIQKRLKWEPFVPFRVFMRDGVSYEIKHPELFMLGKRSATIGVTDTPGDTVYDRSIDIDLLHVLRLEPVEPAAPPTGNGQAGAGTPGS
jgi:hypothetical protein